MSKLLQALSYDTPTMKITQFTDDWIKVFNERMIFFPPIFLN
jgi:hypothetical protein